MIAGRVFLRAWLLAGTLAASVAGAASLGWMKGEAASFFTDRDWQLVAETLDATLDAAADGESRSWANDKSGARGRMTVLGSETRGDMTCRRLRVETTAKGSSSSHQYRFCRRAGGDWAIGQSAPP
jgi:surface antigen